ncbi:MAG TPA: MmcQ/YjbR family DNA-binding protein, partial [Candidatus Angelobacter sp.]|nr:MmcQ/YjbR family DNA-binding protein [Candidatus Angelobacter sp.]
PETTEKTSHGAPTFFVRKRVYCMFANNHHNDGHIAVWAAAEPGLQATLLKTSPEKYFYPPYVGKGGWIGIELARVSDDELGEHLTEAWKMIEAKQKRPKGRVGRRR